MKLFRSIMNVSQRTVVLRFVCLAMLLAGLTACNANQTIDDSHPFFPTQVKSIELQAETLLIGPLVLENGYLRLQKAGNLLIWPRGYTLRNDGGVIKIFDKSRKEVARVGNTITLGGGRADIAMVEDVYGRKLPDNIIGPLFIVDSVVSSVPPVNN